MKLNITQNAFVRFRELAKDVHPIDDYNQPPLHDKKKQVFYRKNKKNKTKL